MIPARKNRGSPLLLILLLAGCAAGPSAPPTVASPTSDAPISLPGSPSESTPGPTSNEPISLEGRILLGLGTVFVAKADGTDRQQVHPPGAYCCATRISPDHTLMLAMPGTDETGAVRGGMLSLDGSEFELLPQPDPTLNMVPQVWSPDGERIAFEGWDDTDPSRTGIYTARRDGTDLVRVTTIPGLPHDSPLDWSPDGSQIVFYRSIRAEPDFPIDIGGSLWVVNADGTGAHRIDTGDVRPWWQARWSPDGSRILFVEERLQPTGALWTVRPDGSDLTKVYEDPDGQFVRGAVWSPDGSQIMFSLDPISDTFQHPETNAVYAINADGTGLTLVADDLGFKGVSEWWQ